ncbi:hypothetical protein PR001_g28304 [Phytophthora rubi]|uniref:Necrosis inducing-like protein NPP1 type n=2 Tax=Phytophthora rubi TaxID=129364 RepID=A0A6A3HCT4_9STRA|nr:hypothetical protein PR001_g28304 [Phytophthora rubi]
MNLRAFLLGAIASLAAVNADVTMINHDTVKPFAQPEPTTESEKSAVKYKPQLHISYGCHPYPAVQADGSVSAGLKWAGWADVHLQVQSGHRHYWSYAIVWTDNPNPDNSTILGVSMSAGVGFRKASPPKSKFVIDGTTVKFDSYRSFWGSKQGVRLTTKSGDTQDLITWEQLTDEARTALSDADFDVNWSLKKVVMPLKDDAFTEKLKKAYPW